MAKVRAQKLWSGVLNHYMNFLWYLFACPTTHSWITHLHANLSHGRSVQTQKGWFFKNLLLVSPPHSVLFLSVFPACFFFLFLLLFLALSRVSPHFLTPPCPHVHIYILLTAHPPVSQFLSFPSILSPCKLVFLIQSLKFLLYYLFLAKTPTPPTLYLSASR